MIFPWKSLIFSFLVTLCLGKYVQNEHHNSPESTLDPNCYRGQEYWCKNITTSVQCNAFKHCVHGVWEKEKPIELDESTVCQTCIDMVKLARDQLNSNETQEELRQVLEASCKVIPVKALRNDCNKMMDDFGSYLVDTLSSQMDPNVVCSVAGLCYNEKLSHLKTGEKVKLNCNNCFELMQQVKGNIEYASNDDIFTALSGICGRLGSFSDICASLIAEHMENVDAMIRNYIRPKPVCTLAGVCSNKFHTHEKLARVPVGFRSNVEVIHNDDLPCELCEQLVKHLRDELVANTTEQEFKQVIHGLCMMTVYKDKCDNLVNEYYSLVYQFLVNELDAKALCQEISICPQKAGKVIRPLLLDRESPQQLPIERMTPLTIIPGSFKTQNGLMNKELCSFCEYFLHFVQQEISLPSSEKEISDEVKKACSKLPSTVTEQCDSFVDTYMATFIALLAQRIDPSQVCPHLGVCPGTLVAVEYNDKPTCPLCLLAMEATLRKIENKTETDIDDALDDLCLIDVFPNSLTTECVKFITDYRRPITDMILAEFTSQESCVYIDLCKIPHSFSENLPVALPVGDTKTNEIRPIGSSNLCVLCEFVMSKVENLLKNKSSEEEIKADVMKVCNYMPKTVAAECKSFVSQYADLVLDLLAQEVDPKEVCTAMSLCAKANTLIAGPVKKCIACELLMDSLRTILTDPSLDHDLNMDLLKACNSFPEHEISFCKSMVMQLAPQIEAALRSLPVGPLVCRRVHMCEDNHGHRVQLYGQMDNSQCYLGSSYWCSSTIRAAECLKIDYCQLNVWHGDKPPKTYLKGTKVI
ncbi:prosaposin [Cimex lectularius]|uniref:Saposin n=1 Tax=Cimex lectularius TaxID=79782 RepID=A0A8I6TIN4_CIMLE|nr:prosaposin [Cimex lectularius]